MTYCIKSKSKTASYFKEYINLVENQFDKKVKKVQCDNGKEYLNQEINNFIREKGTQMLPCPPYVHGLNRVAERYNRSAMDIGRCLLKEARIDKCYWPEIIETVSYCNGRSTVLVFTRPATLPGPCQGGRAVLGLQGR